MRIGIIDAGNIGGTLAGKFVAAGHAVRLANSRGPDTLTDKARETGAIPSTVEDAVRDADAVIIAVPYKAIAQLPRNLFARTLDDAAIIDTGNYYPMRDGTIKAPDSIDPGQAPNLRFR